MKDWEEQEDLEGSLGMLDGVAIAEVKRTHRKHVGVLVSFAQKEAIGRRIVLINLLERQKLQS